MVSLTKKKEYNINISCIIITFTTELQRQKSMWGETCSHGALNSKTWIKCVKYQWNIVNMADEKLDLWFR